MMASASTSSHSAFRRGRSALSLAASSTSSSLLRRRRRRRNGDDEEDDGADDDASDAAATDDEDLLVLAPCAVFYESANDYVGNAAARPGAGGWFLGHRYRLATDVNKKPASSGASAKEEPSPGAASSSSSGASCTASPPSSDASSAASDPDRTRQPVRHCAGSGTSAPRGQGGGGKSIAVSIKTPRAVTVYFDDGNREKVAPGPLSLTDLREEVVDGVRCLVFEDSAEVYCQLEPTKLRVGDLVYARHQDGGNWYRGRIAMVKAAAGAPPEASSSPASSPHQQQHQLCTVAYDDGDVESDIPFGAPPHHGNVRRVVCASLPCHGWLDGLGLNLPSKRCREAASGVLRVRDSIVGGAPHHLLIEYRDGAGNKFHEKRSPGSIADKILADAIENQTEDRTLTWPGAAAAATLAATCRASSRKRSAAAPRGARPESGQSRDDINDENRGIRAKDTSSSSTGRKGKGGGPTVAMGGSKFGGRPPKPPPRQAISAPSAKTAVAPPSAARLGLAAEGAAVPPASVSSSVPCRRRGSRRAASDKKPVYNEQSDDDDEEEALPVTGSSPLTKQRTVVSKKSSKRKARIDFDDDEDEEEGLGGDDDDSAEGLSDGGASPQKRRRARVGAETRRAAATIASSAASASHSTRPRNRNGSRSAGPNTTNGSCVELTALSDSDMTLEMPLDGRGGSSDAGKPSGKIGGRQRAKNRAKEVGGEIFADDESYCVDSDDEEAIPEACTPYLPNAARTVTGRSTSLNSVPVSEMQPVLAHKFINALTTQSTKWACDLISLVNDVHRMVIPAGSLKKLVQVLLNGPTHNDTPFPDIAMMNYCVSYIWRYMDSGPDQKRSLATEIFDSQWEECIGRMTADYYEAPGDETRLNSDAFLRRSQSLHAKMCCAQVVSALLQSGVDECITDPCLRSSHPVVRNLSSHRNGVKKALELAVTAAAHLWIKNGFLAVGDKDFTAPSREVPFPLSPPSEHLIVATKRYAKSLHTALGEICTSLAWLYAIEERLDTKLVARVVANSFRQELIKQSAFDPSPAIPNAINREAYISCIQLEFTMSLGKDLVPQLRCNVAQGLGIAKLWNSIQVL